jgi:biopolymer transport protein ExbB/TolQ/biopolymer transport protein ExbD
MRNKRVRTAKLFCSIDRTPFVAVSATLFAIFVFALMLTNGLPRFGSSDLPKVNNPIWAADADRDDAIVLVVMQSGRVFRRQDPISTDDLRHELRHRLERNAQAQIFLAVDAHAGYGNVATVLAALRSVGVAKVVFLVDQRKIGAPGILYPHPDFWNVGQLWRTMGSLNRADFLLLAFMLANTGAILCFRVYRYSAARRESRTFMRDAASPLRAGKFDEVISIAARNKRSHVANLVAEVFSTYASAARSDFNNTEAIALAQRAFQRRSKILAARLKCGLNTFASIASSAPFIGFFGTVNGILGCFVGTGGSRAGALARVASGIAEALLPGAMGIVVSIIAAWCFYHVRSRFKVLENEMTNAELEAVSCLEAHPEWREQFEHSSATTRILTVGDAFAGRNWEVPYDRQRPLLLAFWCCALYVAFLLAHAWS